MPKYRILDLDNCISDDAWRIAHIDWSAKDVNARYHNYHSLAPFDLLGNGQLLATPCRLIVFTARPIMYRAPTNEWMRRNCVRPAIVIMRNNDQNMPSEALKALQLSWLTEHYGVKLSDIEKAFDDREDVVAMYQRFGIAAEVAKIHDLCAMTPPAQPTKTMEVA